MRRHRGGASEEDCSPCDPGYYCSGLGLFEPTGECDPGYFCPDYAKTTVSKPSQFVCPAGHFCGKGTSLPPGCPPGRYQSSTGRSSCIDCPEGIYLFIILSVKKIHRQQKDSSVKDICHQDKNSSLFATIQLFFLILTKDDLLLSAVE